MLFRVLFNQLASPVFHGSKEVVRFFVGIHLYAAILFLSFNGECLDAFPLKETAAIFAGIKVFVR